MNKFLLLIAFTAIIIAGCKKENTSVKTTKPTTPTHPASDSIYLVSKVLEKSLAFSGTETYTYDDQHRIIRDDVNDFNSDIHNVYYLTYSYNADQTLATVYNSITGTKYDVEYKNGVPVAYYPEGHPDQKDIYTVTDNKVSRIDFYIPNAVGNDRKFWTFTYDNNNNITSIIQVNRNHLNTETGKIDSTALLYQYNAHKGAFYYSNNKFIITQGFPLFPLPGGNSFSSSIQDDFIINQGNTIEIVDNSITKYNKDDLPLQLVSLHTTSGFTIDNEFDYTYTEVKK